ncbi:hypothetical protein SAMN05216535_1082 [Stutzerimonas xanthomarina]|uniref:Uncharacterized protein n=2 Tax=Stutzerimonas xanthomarina TaxID=271420 RepID=A0A1M5QFJ1_9GAMM|nr:hypothetical protein SAMN05216535_1082 [Stutzerimonas xanthomarina]SHH12822.1 hypothetical protein SAMN02744645_2595 [Stutzerimonas xanthomarina DSM 18231]
MRRYGGMFTVDKNLQSTLQAPNKRQYRAALTHSAGALRTLRPIH